MKARTDRRNDLSDWVISPPGELHPTLGGQGMLGLAEAFAPEPAELRRMLLKLRRHFRWSQGMAAAVLGASRSTLEKWELGDRIPSGPAGKMIWLIYSLLLEKEKVKNCWDLALWGKVPCRGDDMDALSLALVGTYFVSNEAMLKSADALGQGALQDSA